MNTITKASREISRINPRDVRALENFPVDQYRGLSRLGINLSISQMKAAMDAFRTEQMQMGMDSLQPTVTTGSMVTPIQFLQNWLPGFIKVITAARKIDQLVGISTIGNWRDSQIVQGIMEPTGGVQPYGDYSNVPFGSWNTNFLYRSIVRFEQGLKIGILEEEVAAAINMDSAAVKRTGAADNLEIERNLIGFFGYNAGNNNTYGFLNDPFLPAYITAANGASTSPHWSTKTFLEIAADIRTMISDLRTQSQDRIDPETTNLTLGLATDVVDYLSVTTTLGGESVRDWLTRAYPRIRVVSAPELNSANGGANVGYLYAETVDDGSTDDNRVFLQVVVAKFQVVGVEKTAKGYIEDYTNATAGVFCKRPFAVIRITGI